MAMTLTIVIIDHYPKYDFDLTTIVMIDHDKQYDYNQTIITIGSVLLVLAISCDYPILCQNIL